jgi:hypothetical protein
MTRDRADETELPTPRTTLQSRYVCVLVWCKSCRHGTRTCKRWSMPARRRAAGPLKFRCSNCDGRLTDFVCTSGGRDRGAAVAGRSSGSADDVNLIRRHVVRRMTAYAAPALRLAPLRPPTSSEAGSTPCALWRPLLGL